MKIGVIDVFSKAFDENNYGWEIMARKLNSKQEIRDFVVKVTAEARHHASEVENIIADLEHEVLNKINLPTDTFTAYERNGQLARTCWVVFSGNRYAFSYSYKKKKIELKKGSIQGKPVEDFDNSTPASLVKSVIAQL